MGKEDDLIKAVKSKDFKKVQKLLTSASMKKKDGETVWQKVDTGHKITKKLTHINVNTREAETGCTPLLLAVLAGLRDVAEMLLFYSADILAQDIKGNTALHLAVFSERTDLVTLLLMNEAHVNSVNADLNTPLHIACQHSSKGPVILKLVQAGANVWLQNKDRLTPLDTAAMYNKKEAVSILMEQCPTLLSSQRAIVEAAKRDNTVVTELLLEYGVDPNKLDPDGSTALHEATRFCRAKAAEILLAFGANASKENSKKETPHSLSKDLPPAMRERFQALFEEYETALIRIPKYLKQSETQLSDSFRLKCLKNYPLLPTLVSWTENTKQYCSSCTEANNNRHALDGNPRTFWVIPQMHNVWTALDLKSTHIITAITVTGWDSPQMVKNFQLQAADSLRGPWSTFTAHTCQMAGSSNPKDPGIDQTFTGFTVQARFLRFYITDNHGGSSIAFQGFSLHGADSRVIDILRACQQQELADVFIENGINSYIKLLDMAVPEISTIVVDPVEAYELFQTIQQERRKVYPMTVLDWLTPPPVWTFNNQDLPDFSVQSNPGVTEEVEVKVQGAELEGAARVRLCSSGEDKGSVAVFQGLRIKSVGKFLITIEGVTTNICLEAKEIEIRQGKRTSNEISAAFDEIQDMLNSIQDTL